MNAKELYQQFLSKIKNIYNENEASIITDWVFEDVANIKKADIIKNETLQISESDYHSILEKQHLLLQHQPIQYVLGKTMFYNLSFLVNKYTLIPRPETEELVQHILDFAKANKNKISILDIGTGSGCIAIAIKKDLFFANVTAIDVSIDALAVAKKNALNNNADVHFEAINFLDETSWNQLGLFDIIVSNPPYIPENEKEKLDKNVVAFEPHQALFVPNNNPLLFYEKIENFGKKHLNSHGKIFLECHENFGKDVAHLFFKNYSNVLIKRDMFEKERIVIATY